ncbi:MAG TPA: thioesterase family protein [Steroidobacteraceae bacterium]|nr:thioesterase family protein [Steroidobacteraceae bacterium]
MPATPIYRTAIEASWIDYNGHLRDAYYALILSYATDALMDRLGLDAAYRAATGNTLYTLEMHIHYLREVHHSDQVTVGVQLLAADHKRVHAGFDIGCESKAGLAATAEIMLLHVHQGATVASTPFGPEVAAAIAALAPAATDAPWPGPGSRRMELRGR